MLHINLISKYKNNINYFGHQNFGRKNIFQAENVIEVFISEVEEKDEEQNKSSFDTNLEQTINELEYNSHKLSDDEILQQQSKYPQIIAINQSEDKINKLQEFIYTFENITLKIVMSESNEQLPCDSLITFKQSEAFDIIEQLQLTFENVVQDCLSHGNKEGFKIVKIDLLSFLDNCPDCGVQDKLSENMIFVLQPLMNVIDQYQKTINLKSNEKNSQAVNTIIIPFKIENANCLSILNNYLSNQHLNYNNSQLNTSQTGQQEILKQIIHDIKQISINPIDEQQLKAQFNSYQEKKQPKEKFDYNKIDLTLNPPTENDYSQDIAEQQQIKCEICKIQIYFEEYDDHIFCHVLEEEEKGQFLVETETGEQAQNSKFTQISKFSNRQYQDEEEKLPSNQDQISNLVDIENQQNFFQKLISKGKNISVQAFSFLQNNAVKYLSPLIGLIYKKFKENPEQIVIEIFNSIANSPPVQKYLNDICNPQTNSTGDNQNKPNRYLNPTIIKSLVNVKQVDKNTSLWFQSGVYIYQVAKVLIKSLKDIKPSMPQNHINQLMECEKKPVQLEEKKVGEINKNFLSCSLCEKKLESLQGTVELKCRHIYHDYCISAHQKRSKDCIQCGQAV
ncbi:UNKNOWN [Stylonychia lemnae]|uniref:RING-type domain-containing protein n=1 Tax=Stylonychia lemnae TaxID=5949 RepID=A0A078AWA7_STYLE|nr:UNKNOWN [Stylonychia lemnae]|eukprot:CDW85083.1 UNKNOWN [Stylonychia lemnae]